ncbi:MAG: hypothetical protein D3914_18200, partial [Candidatus Electrothrix sp. LOE2]|nr:hypothetical protein [Candidatus Electrothrix sp. LOE2]
MPFEGDLDLSLEAWEDVQAFFEDDQSEVVFADYQGDQRVRVRIDASDIIDIFRISSELERSGDEQPLNNRLSLQTKSGNPTFSANLHISLELASSKRAGVNIRRFTSTARRKLNAAFFVVMLYNESLLIADIDNNFATNGFENANTQI